MEKYYRFSNLSNIKFRKCEKYLKRKRIKKSVQSQGYYQVTLFNQNFKQIKFIHRLVCQYFNVNPNNNQFVDHINGNRIDNRAENLRFCTNSQNSMNRKKKKNSLSQFKGVYFHQKAGKWRAQIMHNGQSIHLGYFINEEEAAKQYDLHAIELFQEFAKLNFPLENYQQQNNQQ